MPVVRAGQRVLVWWWNLYWKATVHYVNKRTDTLHIRWAWSDLVTSGYPTRLVLPIAWED
ncbi:MAG: hypothetical protein ACYCOU_25880 [Sulfobacillus sp.]